jgi:hypothetical protein
MLKFIIIRKHVKEKHVRTTVRERGERKDEMEDNNARK